MGVGNDPQKGSQKMKDIFKEEQLKQCDMGGLTCPCCNKYKGKKERPSTGKQEG